jgi:hypothetical protein
MWGGGEGGERAGKERRKEMSRAYFFAGNLMACNFRHSI